MNPGLDLLVVAAAVLASAAYSGAEIGFYTVSRARMGLQEGASGLRERLVARLLADDAALLVTILIGNNLSIELATHFSEDVFEAAGLRPPLLDLVLALVLTPLLFLLAEALPKDLFRRRPHTLVLAVAPFIGLSRIAFWPLERLLRLWTLFLERVFRLGPRTAIHLRGRAAVREMLAEGLRSGALQPRARELAHNVLELRSIPIRRAMRPWSEVELLQSSADPASSLARVRASAYTRLPVVDDSGAVLGYVHQLDVLVAGEPLRLADHVRELRSLHPDTSVDRALARLRTSGDRMAVVGEPSAPLGILTLKDLVEEISGELPAW